MATFLPIMTGVRTKAPEAYIPDTKSPAGQSSQAPHQQAQTPPAVSPSTSLMPSSSSGQQLPPLSAVDKLLPVPAFSAAEMPH